MKLWVMVGSGSKWASLLCCLRVERMGRMMNMLPPMAQMVLMLMDISGTSKAAATKTLPAMTAMSWFAGELLTGLLLA